MNVNELPKIDKVTLNIGVGEGGQRLQNAKTLLSRISGKNPIITKAQQRNPTFKTRKGDPIGVKITLRGSTAVDVVKRALEARENRVSPTCFDKQGNIAFGVKEYIDYPGIVYDPSIGMMGFDVCITLMKPGKRITIRKIRKSRLPKKQRVSPAEAQEFFLKTFKAKIAREGEEREE